MVITKLDLKNDYNDICALWDSRSLPHAHISLLSPFGITAKKEDTLVGALFMYLSYGVPTCMIRFPIIKKEEDTDLIFNLMLDEAHSQLKQLGYKYIICSTNHNGLIKKLKNKNYNEEATNCSHLIGVL